MERNGRGLERAEKRQTDRRYLVFYLRVFDGMSNRIIGHLVDISEKGIMLISDSPLVANEDYRLRMHLPVPVKERTEIMIEATSRWCKADANPDFFLVGFQLHSLSSESKAVIRNLIQEFGYSDG